MQITHTGLVQLNSEKTRITAVQYYPSKFKRELEDTLTIDGKKYIVAVIADDRDDVIYAMNKIIKKQNSIVRRQNKIANAKADNHFYSVLAEAIKQVNNI